MRATTLISATGLQPAVWKGSQTQVRVVRVELTFSWSQTRPVNHCRTRGWWHEAESNRHRAIFSRRAYLLADRAVAGLMGFEPTISSVTGRHPLLTGPQPQTASPEGVEPPVADLESAVFPFTLRGQRTPPARAYRGAGNSLVSLGDAAPSLSGDAPTRWRCSLPGLTPR